MNHNRLAPLVVLVATTFVASHADANHQWRKYSWDTAGQGLVLDLGNNVDKNWSTHLDQASDDWSLPAESAVQTKVVPGSTNGAACEPEAGNVQLCNAEYGTTGWLGVAQIYLQGLRIIAGLAKMNDTYFNRPQYDTPDWRQLVMCQEVAHTFGLDHQDENFNNPNLGTCMDYTSDPDGPPSNLQPNAHDFEQLARMYTGSTKNDDDGGGKSCNPKSPKCNAGQPGWHNPNEWGQLVSGHGGIEVYEKALKNGYRVVTVVTWTLEHAESGHSPHHH